MSRALPAILSLLLATTASVAAVSVYLLAMRRKRRRRLKACSKITELIGNTPLLLIESLSRATGCEILGKAEFLNPGGSPKDRVALNIIQSAELRGELVPGTGATVTEGTVGSTGISLALVCNARGYNCEIYMPDNVAEEKTALLRAMGAKVILLPPVSITDPANPVNSARRRAATAAINEVCIYADQFENQENARAHELTTGPEILRQTNGQLDVFVMGAGTGGTIAGVSKYLRRHVPGVRIYLSDPQGSDLLNKIKHGVLYSTTESEYSRHKNQTTNIVEGIGINRLTRNFELALPLIDDGVRVSDREAVEMSRYMLREEGLFLGSSSAVHLVAAVKVARILGPGRRIVTILCDSGTRHLSKFWSPEYIANLDLTPIAKGLEFIK